MAKELAKEKSWIEVIEKMKVDVHYERSRKTFWAIVGRKYIGKNE